MLCSKCGFDNPTDSDFCTKCGTRLVTQTTSCPQCGAEVSPEIQFCGQCGHDLTREVSRRDTEKVSGPRQASPLPYTLTAGIGAIMMLVSLALPWYAVRWLGSSVNISAGDLLTETGDGGPLWVGSSLPLILIIVFASIVLISVIYSLTAKTLMCGLWQSLGWLSTLCVIGNAVYLLWWIQDNLLGEWVNIVNAGSIVAFIGALVVMFGGQIASKRQNVWFK